VCLVNFIVYITRQNSPQLSVYVDVLSSNKNLLYFSLVLNSKNYIAMRESGVIRLATEKK
jgi:hypothetical protein